jgi:hypothetical protein
MSGRERVRLLLVKRVTSPLKLVISGYLGKHGKGRMTSPLEKFI